MNVNEQSKQSKQHFAFERLDAYNCAREFLDVANALVQRLPKAKGQLGDQLARASESIVLRLAEGVGAEPQSADQRRYFRAARGSAMECAAIVEICKSRSIGTSRLWQQGRALLLRIVQMLSRLSRNR